MEDVLGKYLPGGALSYTMGLIRELGVHLRIVDSRRSKLGDFRVLPGGRRLITVNAIRNPYLFLITLVHEMAHQVVHMKYGRGVRPHGTEWKQAFRELMLPLIHPGVFPTDLLPVVARHFINPRAAYGADPSLVLALRAFDPGAGRSLSVSELQEGETFRCSRNRIFSRGALRRVRYECRELSTGRLYFFPPHIEVEPVRGLSQSNHGR